jgi:hypothetical protein
MNGEISRREDEPLDLSVELEVDRWNGAEQPRVVVRELYPLSDASDAERPAGACGTDCPASDALWWARFGAEMTSIAKGRPGPLLDVRAPEGPRRELVDRRGGAAVACLAELISSGESVLAICADAARRAALADSAADPRRFGAALPRFACSRCGDQGLDERLGSADSRPAGAGLVLADWSAIARRPESPRRFQHVVVIDPPPSEPAESLATQGCASGEGFAAGSAAGSYLHLAFGPAEVELSERLLARDWELRGAIVEIWRELAGAGGGAEGAVLRSVLTGGSRYERAPEAAARCVYVLDELGLCEWRAGSAAGSVRVVSSERTDLARSRAYGACLARHQEAIRFLRSRAQA